MNEILSYDSSTNIFYDLPTEIQLEAFSFLNPRDLKIVSAVSWLFNKLSSNNQQWKSIARKNFISIDTPCQNYKNAVLTYMFQLVKDFKKEFSDFVLDKTEDPFKCMKDYIACQPPEKINEKFCSILNRKEIPCELTLSLLRQGIVPPEDAIESILCSNSNKLNVLLIKLLIDKGAQIPKNVLNTTLVNQKKYNEIMEWVLKQEKLPENILNAILHFFKILGSSEICVVKNFFKKSNQLFLFENFQNLQSQMLFS